MFTVFERASVTFGPFRFVLTVSYNQLFLETFNAEHKLELPPRGELLLSANKVSGLYTADATFSAQTMFVVDEPALVFCDGEIVSVQPLELPNGSPELLDVLDTLFVPVVTGNQLFILSPYSIYTAEFVDGAVKLDRADVGRPVLSNVVTCQNAAYVSTTDGTVIHLPSLTPVCRARSFQTIEQLIPGPGNSVYVVTRHIYGGPYVLSKLFITDEGEVLVETVATVHSNQIYDLGKFIAWPQDRGCTFITKKSGKRFFLAASDHSRRFVPFNYHGQAYVFEYEVQSNGQLFVKCQGAGQTLLNGEIAFDQQLLARSPQMADLRYDIDDVFVFPIGHHVFIKIHDCLAMLVDGEFTHFLEGDLQVLYNNYEEFVMYDAVNDSIVIPNTLSTANPDVQ